MSSPPAMPPAARRLALLGLGLLLVHALALPWVGRSGVLASLLAPAGSLAAVPVALGFLGLRLSALLLAPGLLLTAALWTWAERERTGG